MLKNCQSRNDCDQSFIKIMINDNHTDSNVSEDIIYEDTREYNWWGYNLYREFARKNSYDLSVKNSISDRGKKLSEAEYLVTTKWDLNAKSSLLTKA